jgi:hypothetical protein
MPRIPELPKRHHAPAPEAAAGSRATGTWNTSGYGIGPAPDRILPASDHPSVATGLDFHCPFWPVGNDHRASKAGVDTIQEDTMKTFSP